MKTIPEPVPSFLARDPSSLTYRIEMILSLGLEHSPWAFPWLPLHLQLATPPVSLAPQGGA